jgi:hypothetical protein
MFTRLVEMRVNLPRVWSILDAHSLLFLVSFQRATTVRNGRLAPNFSALLYVRQRTDMF